jgi:hypothetical protein
MKDKKQKTTSLRTSRQLATIQSLFGLFEGYLVLYTPHTLYVVGEFADQVFLSLAYILHVTRSGRYRKWRESA